MTLNDIVKRVKRSSHRGDQNITTDSITSDIVLCVNDARRDLVVDLPKDYLRKTGSFATSNGTGTYSLASDVQEPQLFRYTTGGADYWLTKVPSEREFYKLLYSSSISNNKPRYYFDAGLDTNKARQILLFPTPDATYTINYTYYKDPTATELSTSDLNTEIPDVPSYVQNALWMGALYYFLKGFDDKLQGVAKSDFEQALQKSQNSEESDQDDDKRFRFDIDTHDFRDPTTGIRIV